MQERYEEIMQEVERVTAATDLNGENVIEECKEVISFLKKKLVELRVSVLSHPFEDEDEEIRFFKHRKPKLLGQLMYFYKVLHIESNRPPCKELADDYYRMQQEEQKLFFDQSVGFYQYYRSGATYRDRHYFLRQKLEITPEAELMLVDEEPEFSTGYDRLVARIIAMEMLYAYLTARRQRLIWEAEEPPVQSLLKEHHWTDRKAAAVELIYALHAAGSIDNGQADIIELAKLFEIVFHIDLGDVYHIFIAMRNRKNSRTSYLDLMKENLLRRMDETDCK